MPCCGLRNDSLTGGDAPWFGQFAVTLTGKPAAQSGPIGDSQESWIETTLTGPGMLTFWWKLSSVGNDRVFFAYHGFSGHTWGLSGGEVDWEQRAFWLGEETRTVRWTYRKDAAGSGGADAAWIAQVRFFMPDPEPFELSSPRLSLDGGLDFDLVSEIGRTYSIQHSTDLINWFTWTNLTSTSLVTRFTIPPDGTHHRFYRAVWSE